MFYHATVYVLSVFMLEYLQLISPVPADFSLKQPHSMSCVHHIMAFVPPRHCLLRLRSPAQFVALADSSASGAKVDAEAPGGVGVCRRLAKSDLRGCSYVDRFNPAAPRPHRFPVL